MVKTVLNHVSVVANDLGESTTFYEEIFDFEPIPTPNFPFDAQWLEMADGRQLHLFNLEAPAPRYHHFGVTVADFEAVYRAGKNRDILTDFSDEEDSYQLYSLPDNSVQMYIEDPAENVIEVNWPDVNSLSQSIQSEITDRNDIVAQIGQAASASLNLEPI